MPISNIQKLLVLLVSLILLSRLTKSVPSSECRTVVDLCLVIDGSDSISKGDYEKQRDATANLMNNLDIGDNRGRVGMIVFSTTIAEEVPLSSDKEHLKKKALELPHPRDGTNTALGIKTMRAMFQNYGRPDTPWIGIVITDGISKNPKLTMEEAQKAREEGISLIAVGITMLIDSTELLNIAGVESRVLKLESFDELKGALAGLAKTICPCDAPPVITHAVLNPGPRTVGTVRLYECLEGYSALGSGQIACLENSTWSIPTLECVSCPEPPVIINAVVDPGDNLIRTLRNFQCNPGYISSGPTVIECLADTTWSIPQFKCIMCGDTPIIPHSLILPGPHLIGTVRNYECDKGYIPVGPTNILCNTNATWTTPEFQCVACPDPPDVPNAIVDAGSNLIGGLRNYQCVKGFLAKGKTSIVCQPDATWSPPEFICDVCGETPVVPSAFITKGDHFIGSVRVYQCEKGFVGTGPTDIICQEDGLWSKPSIQCIACLDPPLVQHALLEPGSNLIGSLRNYVCEQGFVATGPTVVECLPDATWAPQQFKCIACTDPPLVSNTFVDIGSNLIGSLRTYTCKDGFVARGKTSIVCQPDAQWGPPEFICDVCPEIPIVPHAIIGPGDYFIGSVRVYQCEKGFRATATTEIVCQKDGTWSQSAFQCVACPEPPLVKNALIEPGSNLIGSVRQYVCDNGFLASGPTVIECSPDGGWSQPQFSCIVCGDTPVVPNTMIRPGPHLIGTVRTYDCVEGYTAAGPTDILCLKDAMWSKPEFMCIACGDPLIVKNAIVDAGFNLIGSIRTYTCTEGYRAKGKTNIVCQADAHWSPVELVCDACPEPPLVQNAVVEPGSYLIGILRQYVCEKGYLASGPTAIECLADATWSSPHFSCIIPHSLILSGSHLISTVRNYECEKGYIPVGPTNILCKTDATWTPPELQCVACPDPPVVPNAIVDAGSNLIGGLRNYQCVKGFLAKGKTSIVCQPDATWSPSEFICDVCGETPVVPSAFITKGDHFIGSVRVYQCEKGFVGTGPTDIICQEDGLWSKPSIQCIACLDPPLVQHALLEPGSNLIGSLRNYVCEQGFVATGPTVVECLPDATWAPQQFKCIACTDPPLVSNTFVDIGSNLIGSLRTYTCKDGFVARGKTSIVCQPDAQWGPPEFICDVCPEIPIVPHAIIGPGDYFIGSVRVYQCEKGFRATATTEIVCQKDGTWSQSAFQCVACPEPPLVKNALIEPGSNLIGSVRQYVCDNGFLASGPTVIECSPDGGWSQPQFSCIVCGDTPVVPNTMIRPGPHLIGTVRTYDCVEGYTAAGPTDILCLKDAMWSKPEFMCIACGDPLIVKNAIVDAGFNLIGSIRTYTCTEGYRAKGKTNIVCQADAHWSPVELVCDACPEPPLVQNAVVEPGSYLIGILRQYVCEKGYLASGPTAIECLADATWSSPHFSCIIPHSLILSGSHLISTVRNYECEKGYIPVGPTNILCKTDATWTPPELQCVACPDPPVVPNAIVDAGSNLIGGLRNYQCVKGFLAKGKTSIVCQPDATWSPSEFICDVCGETPVVPNAFITKGDHFIGSVRVYQCEKGFVGTGPTDIICQEDGLWSKPSIQCIACLDPPLVQHALLEPGSNLIGSLRNYVCEQGFVATGPTVVECLPDATWAPQQFKCIACTDPPLVSNTFVDIGSNLIGSVRTYTCKDGFVARGKTSIVCQPDAHWGPPEFICDVCPEIPIVPHAIIGPGDYFIGSVRVYQCEKGFRATATTEIVCQKDGAWSQSAFQCVACPEPPLVKNALIEPGSNLIGSIRQYVCDNGFLASGPTVIECSPDGGWSQPQFSCIVCGDTPLVPNTMIRPGPHLIGTVRTYDCLEGYTAAGPTDILCLKDAMWSKPEFMCIGSIRTYTCTEGYRAKGKTNIVCQADAHWSPVEFVCDTCSEPPLVQNAVVEPGSYLIGSLRQYVCEKGYLASGPTAIECLTDAAWSSPQFSCIVCGDTPLVTNAMIRPGSHLIDTLRKYDCVEGYLAVGPTSILCQKNAMWSPAEFVCIACEDPPIVQNAFVDVGSNLIGSLRTYICLDGYLAKGKTSLICQPDAHWSPIEFICDLCGGVPLAPYAIALPGPHLIGTVRNYECEKGYVATGSTEILCTKEALWTPPTFECRSCIDPPFAENAIVDNASNLIGSMRTYVCDKGYLAKGDTSIVCQKDATWSSVRFICDVCGEVPIIPHASLVVPGLHLIGSIRTYYCSDGYVATGPTDIVCQEDGFWSAPQFQCIMCTDPPLVDNAVVKSGLNLIGSIRTYVCNMGYLAKGDTSIVCQKDAVWSKPQFICDVCGPTRDVPNAIPIPGDHQVGSVIFYQCIKGFIPDGPTDILCTNNATWSSPLFNCKTCPEPPLVKHALVNPGSLLIGSERKYVCDLGYLVKGDNGIVCETDAIWSRPLFYCDVCGEVPIVKNAEILAGAHLIGSVRQYRCMDGLLATGPMDIICKNDATWSATAFQCISCQEPPIVKNAVVQVGSNLLGSIRSYLCDPGYIVRGKTHITCQNDATWSPAEFVCDVCSESPVVENAVILPGSHLIGSNRQYKCLDGFIANNITDIVCLLDGYWSTPTFRCITCPKPPLVKNAVINPGENLVGSTRMYTCEEGYFAKGSTEITCLPDATWSSMTFICDVCGPVPFVHNAVILLGSNLVGSSRLYECAKGLIPSDSTQIVCQKDGTWSQPIFNCIGCGLPPLVKNAIVSPGESLIGEFRTYTCNEGLIPTGPAGIVCQDNATWTAALFTCVECRSLVDMIIVVDGSDSINAPSYEMLRGAIIKLIPEVEMGEGKARVGIVVFSSDIHEVIPLTGNSASLISKVKSLLHPRDGTNTAKGINKMREMFQSSGRQDAPWLGIVITDGISKQPLQTKQEAESAKTEGVYMIAVGVTDKINPEELQNISSSPKQVLQLKSFSQLSKELVNLMRNVCRKKTPSLLHSILEGKRQ